MPGPHGQEQVCAREDRCGKGAMNRIACMLDSKLVLSKFVLPQEEAYGVSFCPADPNGKWRAEGRVSRQRCRLSNSIRLDVMPVDSGRSPI